MKSWPNYLKWNRVVYTPRAHGRLYRLDALQYSIWASYSIFSPVIYAGFFPFHIRLCIQSLRASSIKDPNINQLANYFLLRKQYLSFPRKGLLKKSILLRHYIPRNDTKCVFRSLRAIRRIARQSQNVHFELWQQARKRESSFSLWTPAFAGVTSSIFVFSNRS